MIWIRVLMLITFLLPFWSSLRAEVDGSQNVEETLGVSSPELEYLVLREASKGGDPVTKLEAFLTVDKNPRVLEKYLPEALELLEESASSGYDRAQYMLGYILVRGQNVEKQEERGLGWLVRASAAGHEKASLWIGITYAQMFQSADDPSLEKQYFAEARRWLLRTMDEQQDKPEISLSAQTILGQVTISNSVYDESGWQLLMDAADNDSGKAVRTLLKLELILERLLEDGQQDAGPILEKLKLYLADRKFR